MNTILDCELDVTSQGSLWLHDAVVYLRYPIRCRGSLEMDRVCLLADNMQHQDMIVLEHARGCRITKSRLDGMGQKSGIFSAATKLEAEKTVFCNMKGGRAVLMRISHKLYPVSLIIVRMAGFIARVAQFNIVCL